MSETGPGSSRARRYRCCDHRVEKAFGRYGSYPREGGGFLVGRRFTVADIDTAEVLRYAQPAPELLEHYPQVTTWLAACQRALPFVRYGAA